MKYNELQPLVDKASVLKGSNSEDIYLEILNGAKKASTLSMARSLCVHIDTMCHPKAWGDRFTDGFEDFNEWFDFLNQLSALAVSCWDNTLKNNS
ncbi:hypothetical protein [Zooshikella ganghwensis]|uniref:Uncharacterized protein n=1 Tax=Zooshikella ganghwensis TaxID=202772 RepID=A0A4P9VMA7_9GAMM|nr:hypothetical protein [Zooshikella ganghwensis]RDH43042.1 hypothetical protein B9G39_06015 [Zooshikella ganghwensis]